MDTELYTADMHYYECMQSHRGISEDIGIWYKLDHILGRHKPNSIFIYLLLALADVQWSHCV